MSRKKKNSEEEEFKNFLDFIKSGGVKSINSNDINMDDIDIEEDEDMFDVEEDCPLIKPLMAMLTIPRPFGMTWHDENIEKFLNGRGYAILHLKDKQGNSYCIAMKKADGQPIPKTDKELREAETIIETFEKEIQSVLVDWLLEIGKNGK